MMQIDRVDDLNYEDMSISVIDRGDRITWESSVVKIAVYEGAALLFYAGLVKEDGYYLWLTVSEEFFARYPMAVRYGFRTLNHFIREGYTPMWCLVRSDRETYQRLVRMAGFEFTGSVQQRGGLLYRKYRRS